MSDAHPEDMRILRAENKLERLSEEFKSFSGVDSREVDEIVTSLLELKDLTRKDLYDLGLFLYIKALRLKLNSLRLVADLGEMELIDQAEVTLDEIDEFYNALQRDIELDQERLREKDVKLIDYIPPLPEQYESDSDVFDLSAVDNPRLFKAITGFFGDSGKGIPIEIPQELLELTQTIDIEKLQDEVLEKISSGNGSTVKEIAQGFHFSTERLTVALVFWVCLFLDFKGKVYLMQSDGDVIVLPFNHQSSL